MVRPPTSAGFHGLIREYGAVCVTTAAEMVELAGEDPTQVALDLPVGETKTSWTGGRASERVRGFDALSTRSPARCPTSPAAPACRCRP